MENYYEVFLQDKIYIQRTPYSKFIEFTLNGTKQNTYEDLPFEIKKIIEYNELIAKNPKDFFEYRIENYGVIIDKVLLCDCPYLKIPSTIENLPVVELSTRFASYDELNMEQIHLPHTIKKLNEYTFQSIPAKYINIPPQITEIPKKCFFDSDIETMDLSNVISIDESAFSDCKNLKRIDISNIKFIGEGTFSHCENLTTVILPETLISIPEFLFYQCFNLEQINFPSNLEEIKKFAFCDTGITTLNFPDTLKIIGMYAFDKCNKLTEFIAPPNLIKIDTNAFGRCANLRKVTLNNNLKLIKGAAFEQTSIQEIVLPKGIDYYKNTFPESTKIYQSVKNKDLER